MGLIEKGRWRGTWGLDFPVFMFLTTITMGYTQVVHKTKKNILKIYVPTNWK